jgi:hypothetical protein
MQELTIPRKANHSTHPLHPLPSPARPRSPHRSPPSSTYATCTHTQLLINQPPMHTANAQAAIFQHHHKGEGKCVTGEQHPASPSPLHGLLAVLQLLHRLLHVLISSIKTTTRHVTSRGHHHHHKSVQVMPSHAHLFRLLVLLVLPIGAVTLTAPASS